MNGLTDAVVRDFQTLLRGGSAAALTDGQLLERFNAGDEGLAAAAFAAIVERHGPMVLRLCRRILRDPHDAEDASQAVFLVLAKRARSIKKLDSVASWLFGVACRVAAQARTGAARRRFHERRGAEMVAKLVDDGDRPAEWSELYEELGRLPEKYRAPLVLCYLEGLTHEEAAGQLRWPLRTVRSRLVAAREKLRGRLLRRGAAVSAGLLAAGEPALTARAALNPGWVEATVRGAMGIHNGKAAGAAAVSATAATLADLVTRRMIMVRVSWFSALIAAGATAFGVVYVTADDVMKGAARPPSARKPAVEEKGAPRPGMVEVRGRVLDPAGKAIPGATIYLGPAEPLDRVPPTPSPRATTGADGSFRFEVEKSTLDAARNVAATASGFGPAWTRLDGNAAAKEVSLTLAADDIPLDGLILDLQGRPVAGVDVKVWSVFAPPGGDLVGWLKAREGKTTQAFWPEMHRHTLSLGGALPAATSGADGRFRLAGIGRDRIAVVVFHGETVANNFAAAATRSDRGGPPFSLPSEPGYSGKLEGPSFTITAAPTRPVVGVVRDRESGKPIAGVKITANPYVESVTDAQGRYRLSGLPKSDVNGGSFTTEIDGQPYLKTVHIVGNPQGLGPITMDIALQRGVWVEGRITDKVNGSPVNGASLEYMPFRDNPAVAANPSFTGVNNNVSDEAVFRTGPDGSYRAVVMPGRGILAIRARGYRTAAPLDAAVAGNVLHPGDFTYQMGGYQGFAQIDTGAGRGPIKRDITLAPGREMKGTIAGPDGKPVAGAKVYGIDGSSFQGDPLPDPVFAYTHPNPDQVETLTFIHEGLRLGAAIDLKGVEEGPVRVNLVPIGTITGRLVDEDGLPRPGVTMPILFDRTRQGDHILGDHITPRMTTDADGRFRAELLVPGVVYQILVAGKGNPLTGGYIDNARSTVKPGEVKDLGDVREKKVAGN
jgi:RNA polymerase sigma factor (sigma-70 family)